MEHISVPEHSKETDSFQMWLDLAEIPLVLSIILLLFPAEREHRTNRFPVVLNSVFLACMILSSQPREENFEGVIVCV
ncbi:hypothetical protein DVH24_039300 [Malus domestica]|uniref:Uncharacterized protein n=1 Tax=Malus domestica TaxID=3750 RepID=A0A498I2D8_MALDO|nr:hypothetical protein DVH24_039300 [Malus domestica]